MTAEKIGGVYFNEEGRAFISSVKVTVFIIGTIEGEGEPLLIGEKPARSARMIQILQTNLLEVKGGAGAYEEFVVPDSMAPSMKVALKSSNPQKIKKCSSKYSPSGTEY